MAVEAVFISIGMFALALVPILVPQVRRYYGPIFLFGTGALLGICLFDLVPDMFEMNDSRVIPLALLAWFAYSIVHMFHSHHHVSETHSSHDSASPYTFFIAITAHCFTSGMLLGVSNYFSNQLAHAILLALLAHKIYEALSVSTLLVGFRRSRRWTISLVGIYVLSFPLGYFLAVLFNGQISHFVVLLISGLAIGSLAGCLIHDFLMPSFRFVRASWIQVCWFFLGIALTFVAIK